ncbi:hypothetical protein Leryth_008066 [Lithospermum erythrorhizon]|nr:hypothetical protein Leryth_008066 [Lithospermum erythrorhizon]
MMHDSVFIPACFTSATKPSSNEASAITRSGQSLILSIYEANINGHHSTITISWYKTFLLHGFSVSIVGAEGGNQNCCEVELKPGLFRRKQGQKYITKNGETIGVAWDLTGAKFDGQTEPQSDFYVAIVCDAEVILLVGDQKKHAYRRTGCRPSLQDPVFIAKREHVFGKKKFATLFKFHQDGHFHEITIECTNSVRHESNDVHDQEMAIRIDGELYVLVKHLQWNFRGNSLINVDNARVELCWDVHNWLFGTGLRNAVFVFKSAPLCISALQECSPSLSLSSEYTKEEGYDANGVSGLCLSVYAWRVD